MFKGIFIMESSKMVEGRGWGWRYLNKMSTFLESSKMICFMGMGFIIGIRINTFQEYFKMERRYLERYMVRS